MKLQSRSKYRRLAAITAAILVASTPALSQITKEQREQDRGLSAELLDLDQRCHVPDLKGTMQETERSHKQCMDSYLRSGKIGKLATDPLIRRAAEEFGFKLMPRVGLNALVLGQKHLEAGSPRETVVGYLGISCGMLRTSAPLQERTKRQALEKNYASLNSYAQSRLGKDCRGIEAEMEENLSRRERMNAEAALKKQKEDAERSRALEELKPCIQFLQAKKDSGTIFDRKITRENACLVARELGMRP